MHMMFQTFFPLTHQFIVKRCGTDTEKCRIISKWIKYLAPGNTPRHHNISRRMGFREHIFDFFTGPHIPVRHTVIQHILFIFRPFFTFSIGNGTFSYTLHNRKCFFTVQPFTDQIRHNIISRTDCRRNGCFSFLNQRLGISKPYVCSMRQSCDSDQIRKCLRFGIDQHLHREISTKLRDSKSSKLTATNIFRLNAKG